MSIVSAAPVGRPRENATAEEALIRRAAAMDATAWDALFETHYEAIQRYAYLRLGDGQAAEDAASEVFLQAVRSIGKYRYRGVAFRAWLYRIAHNVVADARTPAFDDPVGASSAATGADFTPSVVVRSELNDALRQLTNDQQQVIILRFVEDFSIAETAQAMARAPGAIKALQHRALARMRRILEGAD